jgi:hypothetical protein
MARGLWGTLSDAYRRRLERGGISPADYDSGASLSSARGHHRANLSTSNAARATKATTQDKVELAVELMRTDGIGLSEAAKRAHVAPETVRRYGREHKLISKEYKDNNGGGKSIFAGWGVRTVTAPVLTTEGDFIEGVEFNGVQGGRTARYWYAIRRWSDDGDTRELESMGAYRVTATDGTVYTLETDPTAIAQWWESLTTKEQGGFSKLFGSETKAVRRAA